jgi:hypothetical protein
MHGLRVDMLVDSIEQARVPDVLRRHRVEDARERAQDARCAAPVTLSSVVN